MTTPEEFEALMSNTQPSPIDYRDIPFVPSVAPENLPDRVDLRGFVFEIEDQGKAGSCVANMVCSQCETIIKTVDPGDPVDLSRMFLYTATKLWEGRLDQDGLYVRDAYKVARHYGVPEEDQYPYDVSKQYSAPSEQAYSDAQKQKLDRYEAVIARHQMNAPETFKERVYFVKAALNQGLPVGIGMTISRSIFGIRGPLNTHSYEKVNNDNMAGGHAMTIVGYDELFQCFIVQNSWGERWGDGGYGFLPFWIVNEPFFEAWVVRSFQGIGLHEKPGIRLEGQSRYRIKARITPDPAVAQGVTNVWIGGEINGQLYMRKPTELQWAYNPRRVIGSDVDKWAPYSPDLPLEPTFEDFDPHTDKALYVVNWLDLSQMAGGKLFVAYGESPMNWHIEELCTIRGR